MSDPLDLARWRALAEELDAYSPRRIVDNVPEIIAALRSACDEIERLREANDMLCEYWNRRGVCLNCGHAKALEAP